MSAANLLVGSTCGAVYIVRCDPRAREVSIKSTISAGVSPTALIIDIENKCFYCLDANASGVEGHLLTLVPTSFGTIEVKFVIGTGGRAPRSMTRVGRHIYMCHDACYATIKIPTASKSTRTRRSSELPPVAEDTVAETLEELYAISKSMKPNEETTEPSFLLDEFRRTLETDTEMEVTELKQVVPTEQAILKFIPIRDGKYLVGISNSEISSFSVMTDGLLVKQHSMPFQDIIDCAPDDDCCYVLTPEKIYRIRIAADGQLQPIKIAPIKSTKPISIALAKRLGKALILTVDAVLLMDLRSSRLERLEIKADSLCLAKNEQLFFTGNKTESTLSMYSIRGDPLGTCNVPEPAEIVHMS